MIVEPSIGKTQQNIESTQQTMQPENNGGLMRAANPDMPENAANVLFTPKLVQ